MAAEVTIIQTIIGIGVLLFAAKLMGELFVRINLPVVLGELIAGMIVGPFALGAFLVLDGRSVMAIDDQMRTLAEIGAIVILFMAGLEMTPKEFLKGGKSSFTVGTLGVVIPFFAGYAVFQYFGFEALQAMLIATALTATSIAISVQVLSEYGKLKTKEARLIIGAAVVDDILAIAVLSVVTSIAADGNLEQLDVTDITFTILKILGFFAIMFVVIVTVMPRLFNASETHMKGKGALEGMTTAAFFGSSALAGILGLSPILGAFVVGMALSTTKVIGKIEDYTHKIGLIFAPLFFAIVGAQVDFRGLDWEIVLLSLAVIGVAILTKLVGCGLPAMYFLKNREKGMRVGIGMISRGEVGLIVAGVGITTGVLTSNVYSIIVIMVAVTTIITPIWLKMSYRKELREHPEGANNTE